MVAGPHVYAVRGLNGGLADYWDLRTVGYLHVDQDGSNEWRTSPDRDHAYLVRKIPVANHHGDLCFHDGKVYVAVNLGKFNDPAGNAGSWVYVYDADGHWWFGCYGNPQVMLKTDKSFGLLGKYRFGCSLGVAGLPGGRFVVARGRCQPGTGCSGSVVVAHADAEKGLVVDDGRTRPGDN